jgi:hypothetical protein
VAAELHKAVTSLRSTDTAVSGRGRLSRDQLETLRFAAQAYVRGDLSVAADLKPAIEGFFEHFQVAAWPFILVTVKSNAVLEFGPGAHNLTAHKILVEPGGTIRSRGHLTVNCTVLERDKKKVLPKLPPHVFTPWSVRGLLRR